jgi:hypothetical protein
MERADHCLSKAAECEQSAMLAPELAMRILYLDLARKWRETAQQVEELERQHVVQSEP